MQNQITRNIRKIKVYKLNPVVESCMMIPHINECKFLRRNSSFSSDKYSDDIIKKNNEEKKKKLNVSDNICADHSTKIRDGFNCNVTPNETHKRKFERILLIEKYTKYDDLKKQGFKDDYIFKNFFRAYISHFTHTLIVNNIIHILRTTYKSHVSILKAYKKNIENIFINSSGVFFPDAIFSVGGDGTYLESAHIIANKYIIDEKTNRKNKRIELIGINSDPRGSEGKLCLNYFNFGFENELNYNYQSFEEFEKTYSKKKRYNIVFIDVLSFINKSKENKKKIMNNKSEEAYFEDLNAIDKIIYNNSLSYEDTSEENPILEKKDNSNVYFKNKNDDKKENKQNEKKEEDASTYDLVDYLSSKTTNNLDKIFIRAEEYAKNTLKNFFETDKYKKIYRKYITVSIKKSNNVVETYKSINEVYIYEAVKNNICTYINIDNKILKKLKSTALLITSGTGSTAWAYNVNKIDKKRMKTIIEEFLKSQNDIVKNNISNINFDIFSEYINNSICFHPNSKYMKCIIKEPVENSVYDSTDHIYNCNYIDIKTCTNNTIVYIDGIYNIKIQPNDSVILHIRDDDFIISYK